MKCPELRETVCRANLELVRRGLVIDTWGNVSGLDRAAGVVAIKPSGVAYAELTPAQIVLLDLDGKVLEGSLRPSSDTPTHLALYRAWPELGGVAHTHSVHATIFAQASRSIPCFGTTHADHFHGTIPVTRSLTPDETADEYEANTGKVIIEAFAGEEGRHPDPISMPAALVAHHGPFTWGRDANAAVENSAVLEIVAQMAFGSIQIAPGLQPLHEYLMDKHYLRKHGSSSYYGQK